MYDIVLKEDRVIMSGITTGASLCGKRYIVYRAEGRKDSGIYINTYFYRSDGGMFHCSGHYGCRLCESEEKLRGMTVDEIETAAYNAWMTGAR